MMPAQSTAATTVAPPGPPTGTRLATTYANSSSAAATPARAVKVPAPAKTKAAQMDAEVEHLQQMTVRAPRVPANGSSTAVLKSLTQTEEEVINDIRGFCAPGSPVENQLRLFVEGFLEYQRSCGYSSSHRERSNKLLAQELSSKGYHVALRHHSSQSNSTGVSPSPHVRDTYIVFSGVPGHATEDYVIELDFRDRFNIANPTPFYNTCLAAVPEVWVGPLEQLLPLVELLCYEMCIAFEDRNLEMPPWRSHSKVASRWLSSQVQSFSVDSINPMAQSPTNTPPRDSQSSESSMSCFSGQSSDNTGLTLTPLQISQRSCSLNFDKVEVAPTSPVKETSHLKKATSLLALHILSASSPRSAKSPVSPAIA